MITSATREAYDAFAEHYDSFTADHDYDDWMGTLERLARRHGLRGRRVLDVACGTGKSFLPMLEKGYRVSACDISTRMLAQATAKVWGRHPAVDRLFVADMRRLPETPAVDLVTCIDDAINYLISVDDVVAALTSIRRALRPGGMCLFDVNTLRTYTELFETTRTVERDGTDFVWTGERLTPHRTGGLYRARIEVYDHDDERRHITSTHVQRHHPGHVVARALGAAGLDPVACYGQMPTGETDDVLDEHRHTKAVYLARRPQKGST